MERRGRMERLGQIHDTIGRDAVAQLRWAVRLAQEGPTGEGLERLREEVTVFAGPVDPRQLTKLGHLERGPKGPFASAADVATIQQEFKQFLRWWVTGGRVEIPVRPARLVVERTLPTPGRRRHQ